MKNKSIISLLFLAMGAGFTTTSCSDMLETDANDKLYVSASDTLYSYWGIMKKVQNIAERNVIIGEAKGDLVAATPFVSDSIQSIANYNVLADGDNDLLAVKDYYAVINNCNFYIHECDTAAVSNNVKYKVSEYAQVQAVRAWTYLQLVNLYGEVPFFTEPIKSLSFLSKFDGKTVTKATLASELASDLEKLKDVQLPNYDNYDNGSININSQLCMFPIRLVLGDLYLAAEDYAKAANSYYEWMLDNKGYLSRGVASAQKVRGLEDILYSSSNYLLMFNQTSSTTNEMISVIPSAANKQYGKMLTDVVRFYGFTPDSKQTTDAGASEDGSEATTSGAVTLTRNYKKEVDPSQAYLKLNEEQKYSNYLENGLGTYFDGDARGMSKNGALLKTSYEGDPYSFVQKFCPSGNYSYIVPVYRRALVWLRYAEAVNRLGFPTYAFAVLKDGMCKDNIPTILDKDSLKYDIVFDEEGVPDTLKIETVEYQELSPATSFYISLDDVKKAEAYPFLNFTSDKWTGTTATVFSCFDPNGVAQKYSADMKNFGVHARGCGVIDGKKDTTYYDYDKLMDKAGAVTQAEKINAVENLIVDELALECGFEGNRFADLVRIANHKNNAGQNGTEWFAEKISTRSGEKDASLYNRLLDIKNWFLQLPKSWK